MKRDHWRSKVSFRSWGPVFRFTLGRPELTLRVYSDSPENWAVGWGCLFCGGDLVEEQRGVFCLRCEKQHEGPPEWWLGSANLPRFLDTFLLHAGEPPLATALLAAEWSEVLEDCQSEGQLLHSRFAWALGVSDSAYTSQEERKQQAAVGDRYLLKLKESYARLIGTGEGD